MRLKGRFEWEGSAGEEHLRRAMALNTNSVTHSIITVTFGTHGLELRQWNEGIVKLGKAVKLDPQFPPYIGQLARLLMFNRQYDEATKPFSDGTSVGSPAVRMHDLIS